jgi:hypothetical protein
MYTVCSPFTTAQPAVPTKNLIQRNWGGPPSVRRLVSRWSKTQLTKIIKLPRATARATQKAAVRRLRPIGDFVHRPHLPWRGGGKNRDHGLDWAALAPGRGRHRQSVFHSLRSELLRASSKPLCCS